MNEDDAARAFDEAARRTKERSRLKVNFPLPGEVVAGGATSKYRGVSWLKARRKWHAQITINKKQTHLGCFAAEEDAGRAYDDAARKYRKLPEDLLNFPRERSGETCEPAKLAFPTTTLTSMHSGVSWCSSRKKWTASIKIHDKDTFLGNFGRESDAARAYDRALRTHFADIPRWLSTLNFPTPGEEERINGALPNSEPRGDAISMQDIDAPYARLTALSEPVAWIDSRGDCYDRKGRLLSP